MNYLSQVQRGIDYIEANLGADIQPAEVARHAGISHWHFQRIWKALTSETLKGYIRARRFASSLELLAATDDRIVEISLAAGFESQASFTRAFKKAFGVTPADYRRRHRSFPFLRKVRIDADYLRHLHAGVSLEPELYEQAPTQLIGVRTSFFGVDSEKNNLARKIPPLWAAFLPRLGEVAGRRGELAYGAVRQTPAHTDELEYFAAVPVEDGAPVPRGMVRLEVPRTRYARFAHRGRVANLDHTVNYIYASWLLRSGMRHTYGCDLEIYGAEYRPDSDASLVHYAIPVEPIAG